MRLIINMRIFLVVLTLIFSFQSLTKADDIRDFEIEGISIEKSALNYFDVKALEKAKKEKYSYYYPENKFVKLAIATNKNSQASLYIHSDIYEDLSITIKPKDKKYIIYAVSGRLFCKANINDCFSLQNQVVNDLADTLKNAKRNFYKDPHPSDVSNQSFVHGDDYYFENNGSISISVYDWSEKMNNERDWQDSLQIGVNTNIFDEFLWSLY